MKINKGNIQNFKKPIIAPDSIKLESIHLKNLRLYSALPN